MRYRHTVLCLSVFNAFVLRSHAKVTNYKCAQNATLVELPVSH